MDLLTRMDFTPALSTLFVTLREGVEAALVVGIVLACLNKAQQRQLNRWVYLGILAGLLGSILTGIIIFTSVTRLQQAWPNLEPIIEPLFDSLFCAIAIVMLSWMLLWMTRQARFLKADIEGSIASALSASDTAAVSIFSLVCIAVLREGIETVLFVFTSVQQSPVAGLGALAGLVGATLIGLALFKWGVKINLRLFFQVMGVLLLLIVGGLVITFFRNLDATLSAVSYLAPLQSDVCISQESCLLGPMVWDARTVLPDKQFPGVLLKTVLGYRDRLYAGQLIAYGLYMVAVGSTYFRNLSAPPQRSHKPVAES